MNNAVLNVTNLKKTFKQNFKTIEVLKDVSFDVKPGSIYGFLGPNGAGKTTTLKCILGFLSQTDGDIELFDSNPHKDKSVFKRLGYAPENTYFYEYLNGVEFLLFMGGLSGMKKSEILPRADELLEKLGLLYAKNRLVKSYSKGMKQRLGLAASLINDPEMIFWDEPMSGLDPLGRVLVKDLMRELKDDGKTILFNTHILSDVQEVADEFSILFDGKIIFDGNPKELGMSLEQFFIDKVNEYKGEHHLEIK